MFPWHDGLDTHSFDEDRAMRVQVCRWQSVAPEHRQQAVDLLRQAFPDMQGEGYAIPGQVALVWQWEVITLSHISRCMNATYCWTASRNAWA